MKPGPVPHKGFALAIPVALRRGKVQRFIPIVWNDVDFAIIGNGRLAMVCIRLAERIRAPVAEIEQTYSPTIAGLSTVPEGGPVSRELWLYSRNGVLRFFRLGDAGLTEIDCFGICFVNGKPVTIVPVIDLDVKNRPSGPGTDERIRSVDDEPHLAIIRWMGKREERENSGSEKNPAPGPDDPEKNADSPTREPDVDRKAASDGLSEEPQSSHEQYSAEGGSFPKAGVSSDHGKPGETI